MIKFWRTTDQYGCFSNFARFAIHLDDKWWPTTEHYYQAMKSEDADIQEQIRQTDTPKDAKRLGQIALIRSDWEDIKYEIMLKAVRAKVEQYTSIKDMLLNTGKEEIGEDSPYDYEWGLGADGSGKNLLGKVLMQIRSELLSESLDKD